MTRPRARAPGHFDDDPIATTTASVARRRRCEVSGAIVAIESSERPTIVLDITIDDATGTLVCTFSGRREIPGFALGRSVQVAGRLVRYGDRQCLLNPIYELGEAGCASSATSS